jgi:hypothetical protein
MEQRHELEDKLNEVLNKWIKKHGLEPTFYSVVCTEKITFDLST